MFDTDTASNGVKFALLEGQLLSHEIDRAAFVDRAANLGLIAPVIGEAADLQRRGSGGAVFVQPAPDPSPIASAYLNPAALASAIRF